MNPKNYAPAKETIEVRDRIYYENGQPTRWLRSLDGQTWTEVDCSMYPDGKPPFFIINTDHARELAYIEQRYWEP